MNYIHCDGDLPVCTNLDCNWEDNAFLKDIGQPAQEGEITDPESNHIEDVEIVEDAPLVLNTYKEVIVALENVQKFLEVRGHGAEASGIAATIESCVDYKLKGLSQSALSDFFLVLVKPPVVIGYKSIGSREKRVYNQFRFI